MIVHRSSAPGFAVLLAALALHACTWVALDRGAEQVRVLRESEAGACARLGTVHARTAAMVGPFGRSPLRMRDELVSLARNEALELQGNAIAALGEAERGRQVFAVYRCQEE